MRQYLMLVSLLCLGSRGMRREPLKLNLHCPRISNTLKACLQSRDLVHHSLWTLCMPLLFIIIELSVQYLHQLDVKQNSDSVSHTHTFNLPSNLL